MNTITVANAIEELGSAWRGDWMDFDGRTLQSQLRGLVDQLLNPSDMTLAEWREEVGICPHGGGEWEHHCYDLCRDYKEDDEWLSK